MIINSLQLRINDWKLDFLVKKLIFAVQKFAKLRFSFSQIRISNRICRIGFETRHGTSLQKSNHSSPFTIHKIFVSLQMATTVSPVANYL